MSISALTLMRAAVLASLPLMASSPAKGGEPGGVLALCADCHGGEGRDAAAFVPRLHGQKEAYLAVQLTRMVDGKRHNVFMTPVLGALGAEEAETMSAFYAGLPVYARQLDASPPTPVARCLGCHGRDGVSVSDEIPNLARQPKAYLVEQIQRFRTAARSGPSTETRRPQPVMEVQVMLLSDGDIQRIASYFAGESGPALREGSRATLSGNRVWTGAGEPDRCHLRDDRRREFRLANPDWRPLL